MKVIQVIPTFELAGAERMCETLIDGLKRQQIDVVAVSLFSRKTVITDRLEQNDIPVLYLDKKSGLDLSMIGKLKKIFKKEKPDIVHAHLAVIKYVGPATLFSKIKVIHTIHNVADKECGAQDRFVNRLFYKMKKVFPVSLSEKIRLSVEAVYKIPLEKIPVVYNGVDLSECMEKQSYELGDTIKILHIGRFEAQKNHIGLLEAFQLFQKKYPNSLLRLIGEGDLRDEIERYVKENGLSEKVCLLGKQANVHPYLTDADMFILPSYYEGVPMTIIEAMGTGLPIVATNVGGIPDLLSDGKTAILTSLDVKEIAGALERYAESAELRRNYGQAALAASARFDATQMTREYLRIYNANLNK